MLVFLLACFIAWLAANGHYVLALCCAVALGLLAQR